MPTDVVIDVYTPNPLSYIEDIENKKLGYFGKLTIRVFEFDKRPSYEIKTMRNNKGELQAYILNPANRNRRIRIGKDIISHSSTVKNLLNTAIEEVPSGFYICENYKAFVKYAGYGSLSVVRETLATYEYKGYQEIAPLLSDDKVLEFFNMLREEDFNHLISIHKDKRELSLTTRIYAKSMAVGYATAKATASGVKMVLKTRGSVDNTSDDLAPFKGLSVLPLAYRKR